MAPRTFVLGDSFTITVPAGSGKVRELNLTGTDGSEDAYGIMIAGVDTTTSQRRQQAVAICSGCSNSCRLF